MTRTFAFEREPVRGYHQFVPIYEFDCGACGERFEELVGVGTETVECRACGTAEGARRVSRRRRRAAAGQDRGGAQAGAPQRRSPGPLQERFEAACRLPGGGAGPELEAEERRERWWSSIERRPVCDLCPLSESRTNVVFGAGNADADLMFVGEAPGAEEDRQGLPFVGRAGGLLDAISWRGSA